MDEFFKKLADDVQANNSISNDMFSRFNVKRGLRNEDGSGVIVGLTEISSVIGYMKLDEETIPCEGQLFYRGIDVLEIARAAQTANRFSYEETVYLLLAGKLPTEAELDYFRSLIAEQRVLPKNFVRDQLSTFRTPDIMNALARSVLALYTSDKDPDSTNLENLLRQSISLIAKVPVITAYAYRVYLESVKGKSLILHRSNADYTCAEDFLSLVRDDGKFTDEEAKILDLAMMLHADHGGGNNSTFTARVVTSSGTDTYSAVSAAMGSLKGPLHGGANLYVMKMMDDIKANVPDWTDEGALRAYVRKIIFGEVGDRSGKVFGFGHAVYTLSDPRAAIFREYGSKLSKECGREAEFNLYLLMEKVVPEVFNEVKGGKKVVSPNVDFYSGFVYECLGIAREVFTPVFAMARTSGWLVHRIEEILVQKRIIRPAYKNVTQRRSYLSLDQR